MPPPRRAPFKLATPRLEVWLSDPWEDEDAEPILVQTTNADLTLTERTARKHGWGSVQDSPIRATAFMAYAALKRRGQLPDPNMLFEAFDQMAVSISTWEPPEATAEQLEDEDGADEATPTRPGPVPG